MHTQLIWRSYKSRFEIFPFHFPICGSFLSADYECSEKNWFFGAPVRSAAKKNKSAFSIFKLTKTCTSGLITNSKKLRSTIRHEARFFGFLFFGACSNLSTALAQLEISFLLSSSIDFLHNRRAEWNSKY